MKARAEYAAALVLDAVGAGGALLIATRHWQTIVTPRSRPFAADVLRVSGRSIDAAPTAVALVALAGVVAVLATRGLVRSVVGGVVLLAGVVLVWRSLSSASAVGPARARELVRSGHPRVSLGASVTPQVSGHEVWPVLSALCGLLVVLAGLAIVLRGPRWAGMSARYEAPHAVQRPPTDDERAAERARGDAALWSALERGEDPTTVDPSSSP